MKNHKFVNGQLLQTNKKFSHLKQRQREKIIQWMKVHLKEYYVEHGKFPKGGKQNDVVLNKVYDDINDAGIWIPDYEVKNYFIRKKIRLQNKVLKSINTANENANP